MIVTASFPRTGQEQEILSLRVGSTNAGVLSGTQAIRSELGDALYQRILARDYAHTVIPPASPLTTTGTERVASVLQPTQAIQFIAVSAFQQTVQLGSTCARLDQVLGNDEIVCHFWSSG